MIAVLDTSAVVEVVLKRESSALFTDIIAEVDLVIVPTLMIREATKCILEISEVFRLSL